MTLCEMKQELADLAIEVKSWETAINNGRRLELLFDGLKEYSLKSFRIVMNGMKQDYQESQDNKTFMPFPINNRIFRLTEHQERKNNSPHVKKARETIVEYEKPDNPDDIDYREVYQRDYYYLKGQEILKRRPKTQREKTLLKLGMSLKYERERIEKIEQKKRQLKSALS